MAKRPGVLVAGLMALALPLWGLEVKGPSGAFHLGERSNQGVRWVCSEELARALKGTTSKDPVSAYPVITVQGKRILVSTASPMVSVEGRIVRLGRAAQEAEGCLWLPEEFLTAVLPLVLGGSVTVEGAKEAPTAPPSSPAAGRVAVDVSVSSDLVKVTLSGAGTPQAVVSRKGREVEVRLPAGSLSAPARDLGRGIVERVAPDQEGRLLRIRLGDRFGSLETLKRDDPPGLVLLLKGQSQEVPAPAVPPAAAAAGEAAAPPPPSTGGPAEPPQPPPVRTPEVDVVAIDPGHGGSDTGALGASGAAEKELTLTLARKLAALLERRGFKAVLTRSADSAVPLKQRAALANFNQADLFLSIHLNASPAAGARGPEVYFMSHEATDLWSKDLAAKENAAGDGSPQTGGGLDLVLWEMAQTAHLVESSYLAESIQKALNGLMGTDRRAVRQAPFAVLEGATMPAVLVEVGFLSNAEEEKKLNDPAFQDRVAERLAEAVAAFKERYENPPAPLPGE